MQPDESGEPNVSRYWRPTIRRIANWGLCCQAKRLPVARVATSQIAAIAKNRFLRLVETVERVQRANRQFRVGGIDQYRKLDFRGRDGADVDVARGQRRERLGGDAGMRAHAAADYRDFGDVGRAVDGVRAAP